MSAVQTVLVFLVAPLAITAILSMFAFGPGAAKTPRYRPGRAWAHEPVWYAPHPAALRTPAAEQVTERAALTSGSPAPTRADTAAGGAGATW